MKKCLSVFLIVASMLAINLFISQNEAYAETISTAPLKDAELVSCFDYYHFGSAEISISALSEKVGSGSPVSFSGNIFNKNQYPIVQGSVYVRVFRKDDSASFQKNGYSIVDQFYAQKGITIKSNEKIPFSFSWKIPAFAKSGDYYVATYFIVDDKYNLTGLSFTDDIVGGTASFSVVGDNQSLVYLDKNTATLNNNSYSFAAAVPTVSSTSTIDIVADLVNQTKNIRDVQITYTLYYWDGADSKNILDKKSEKISLEPSSVKKISYSISDKTKNVYYLTIEAAYKDTKSILNFRVSRNGIEKPRINFPSIVSYPLTEGKSTSIFSCMHNANNGSTKDPYILQVRVFSNTGRLIHGYRYSGLFKSAMMGSKSDFIPDRTYNDFTVVAEIINPQNNQIVDSAKLLYSCDLLSTDCGRLNGIFANPLLYLILGSLIIVAVLILVIKRKIGSHHGITLSLLVVVAVMYQVLAIPSIYKVDAQTSAVIPSGEGVQSVLWNYTAPYYPQGVHCAGGVNLSWGYYPVGDRCPYLLNDLFAQVAYGARVYKVNQDNSLSPLHNGDQILVGTKIKFTNTPFANENIAWFTAGGVSDSPYGYFINSLSSAVKGCSNIQDKTGEGASDDFVTPQNYYFPFSVIKPNVTVSTSGSAVLNNNNDGTYTVSSAGTIVGNVAFAQTSLHSYPSLDNGFCDPLYTPNAGYPGLREWHYNDIVPAQNITFNLSAIENQNTNHAPSTPTVTVSGASCVPSGGSLNQTYTVISTDSDADQLYYELDIDGLITRLPSSGIVTSGTPVSYTRSWTNAGSHIVKARATDSHLATSSWVTQNVDVTDCPVPHTLTVTIVGSGNVSGGLSCASGSCSQSYTNGTNVSISQSANPGYSFTGWSGACTGSGSCAVVMDADKSVTATFANGHNGSLTCSMSANPLSIASGQSSIVSWSYPATQTVVC